jgi:hypothetical protein
MASCPCLTASSKAFFYKFIKLIKNLLTGWRGSDIIPLAPDSKSKGAPDAKASEGT